MFQEYSMSSSLDTPMSEEEEPPKNEPLPFDLLEEILTRLPPKSLLRFTCVSKSFFNLIQTPQFITSHFTKSQEITDHMILKDSLTWNIFVIDCNSCNQITQLHPPFSNPIQCLISCNGLVCVEDVHGSICIWNPCINDCMKVHGVGNRSACYREDSGLSYGLGFGYNSVLKDYEVVKVVSGRVLSVYNVRMREWVVIKHLPYKLGYMREGLFFNGAIHWIALPDVVFAYDLGGRKYREMKLPGFCKNVNWINVAVLEERLCVLCDCGSRVQVWVMREYGVEESWVMLFADAMIKNYVGVTRKGEFLLQETGGGLCLYDPRGRRLRDLVTDDTRQYLSLGTRFVESLLPLP